MAQIQTRSGKLVNPFDLSADDIDLLDIAHSLSMQCRYMGHSSVFYSVAEHSVNVAAMLEVRGYGIPMQATGLLHDASEAYLMDVPKPMKETHVFEPYRAYEYKAMSRIMGKYGCAWPLPAIVVASDAEAYELEQPIVRGDGGHDTWSPLEAKRRFLAECHRLGLL